MYINRTKKVTIYQCPFVQPILLVSGFLISPSVEVGQGKGNENENGTLAVEFRRLQGGRWMLSVPRFDWTGHHQWAEQIDALPN